MTNAELIAALRNCSSTEGTCAECSYKSRVYPGTCNGCKWDMMRDAAYALEAADKQIARLEEDLKTREAEREVMQDTINVCEKRIAELEKSYSWKAYAALEESIEGYKTRIAELEAQLPKEGEWIEDEYGYIHCSKCEMEWDEPEHPNTNYCPNCGAKMKNVTDCHTLNER